MKNSNQLNINGVYNLEIKKTNEAPKNFSVSNNITVNGMKQIFRFLNKDVVFPNKVYNDKFATPISYNNDIRKISIKNFNQFDQIEQPNSTIINNHKINNLIIKNGSKLSLMLDGNFNSFTQFKQEQNNEGYSSLQLFFAKPLNIKKIGLLMSSSYLNQMHIQFKTEGYYINVEEEGLKQYSGDYVKIHKVKFNGKNVYVNRYRINENYHYNYLYYFKNNNNEQQYWVIGSSLYSNTFRTENKNINGNWLREGRNEKVLTNMHVYKYTDKWHQVSYRREDQYARQHKVLKENTIDELEEEQLFNNIGLKKVQDRYYNWVNQDYQFDNNDCYYHCFSFQSIQQLDDIYKQKMYETQGSGSTPNQVERNYITNHYYKKQQNGILIDDNHKFVCENILGCAYDIQAIRIKMLNVYESNNNQLESLVKIYSLDIYEDIPTPYNPLMFKLETSTTSKWFYVDNIRQCDDNSIIFQRVLDYGQGNTQVNYDGQYQAISLYGNFDYYDNDIQLNSLDSLETIIPKKLIHSSLPTDIEKQENNQFSRAVFEQPWSKSDDEQVVISYKLILD